jgi:hypothetical protein
VLLATQAQSSVEDAVRPYFPSPGWLDRWEYGTQPARYLLLRLLEAFTPNPLITITEAPDDPSPLLPLL